MVGPPRNWPKTTSVFEPSPGHDVFQAWAARAGFRGCMEKRAPDDAYDAWCRGGGGRAAASEKGVSLISVLFRPHAACPRCVSFRSPPPPPWGAWSGGQHQEYLRGRSGSSMRSAVQRERTATYRVRSSARRKSAETADKETAHPKDGAAQPDRRSPEVCVRWREMEGQTSQLAWHFGFFRKCRRTGNVS